MKKVFTFILFAFCSITWAQTTPKQLKKALKESAEKGIMFGHHDDTIYGYTWGVDEKDRSDTREVVGMYPAMMSFDLRQIEKRRHNRNEWLQDLQSCCLWSPPSDVILFHAFYIGGNGTSRLHR